MNNKQIIDRNDLVNAIIKAYKVANDEVYFELLNAFESLIYDELKKDKYINVYTVNLSRDALKLISKN